MSHHFNYTHRSSQYRQYCLQTKSFLCFNEWFINTDLILLYTIISLVLREHCFLKADVPIQILYIWAASSLACRRSTVFLTVLMSHDADWGSGQRHGIKYLIVVSRRGLHLQQRQETGSITCQGSDLLL